GASAALIVACVGQLGEAGFTRQLLIPQTEGVAGNGVVDQGAPQTVVVGISIFSSRRIRAGVEVTQIGGQFPGTQIDSVLQANEVLLIPVIQCAVIILCSQVVHDLIVGASNGEAFGLRHSSSIAILIWTQITPTISGTAGVLPQLSGCQGQAIDILGGNLCTFEELRQQAGVVGNQHWSVRAQSTDMQFSLGHTCLQSG